ncbi:regulatory subunit of type II PKA R-subunit [Cooperia oncophora]
MDGRRHLDGGPWMKLLAGLSPGQSQFRMERAPGMDVNLRYKVPDGLRPLLEALARETLRSQPKDIIRFAQLFFEELQHHRKKVELIIHTSLTVFINHQKALNAISNPNTDIICDPVAYEMFRTDLQRRYNNDDHVERCSSPLDEAATKIQAAFRGHCETTLKILSSKSACVWHNFKSEMGM